MTETRPHHFPPDGGPQQDAGAGPPAGGIPRQAGPQQPPWGAAPGPQQPPPWGAPPSASGYPPPPGPFPHAAPRSGRKALIIVLVLVLGIPVTLLLAAVVTVALRDEPVSGTPGTGAAAPQAGATTPVGGQRTLIQLQKGDCYNSLPLPPDGSTVRVASVAVVPCTEAHTGQVIATLAYKDVSWAAGGDARSTEGCTSAFNSGVRPEAQRDSRYTLGRMHRDLDQPGGAKTAYVACVVATDAPVTGSVLK